MTDFLKTFQAINAERSAQWLGSNTPSPLFFATELGGEAGEVLNEVKKLEREALGMKGSRTTVEKLADELADVFISLHNLAACYDIALEASIIRKFNATSEKNGFPQRLPE